VGSDGVPRRGLDGRFIAPPSPRTLFATTGGSGDGRGSSQASIKNIMKNRDAPLAACANITSVWGLFPSIRRALLRKAGCHGAVIDIGDFPAVVLTEVAADMRSQMGAYITLRESARAAGTLGGSGAAFAGTVFSGDEFDVDISTAIDTGEITLDSTPKRLSSGRCLSSRANTMKHLNKTKPSKIPYSPGHCALEFIRSS
jgi:hypothetical protein